VLELVFLCAGSLGEGFGCRAASIDKKSRRGGTPGRYSTTSAYTSTGLPGWAALCEVFQLLRMVFNHFWKINEEIPILQKIARRAKPPTAQASTGE
jgi:hypothetical protein